MNKDFVRGILDKLFSSEPSGKNQPLLSGKLVRNEKFLSSYNRWLLSDDRERELQTLTQSFENSSEGDPYNGNFQLYTSPQANGFFFNSNLNFNPEHYAYWIDYFKNTLLEADYRIYTSDFKTIENPSGIQEIQRHYLKPGKMEASSFPIDQKYGNVSIELVNLDQKPSFVKVMASVYSDRNYADPLPFNRLVEKLLARR